MIRSAYVGSGDLVTGAPCYSDMSKRELHVGLLCTLLGPSVRPSYHKEFNDFYCINFEVNNKFETFLTSRKLIN